MDLADILIDYRFNWIFLSLISIVFSILVIYIYYRFDKYDPKPISLLLRSFGYGLLSPLISLPLYFIIIQLFLFYEESTILFVEFVLLAPMLEELAKTIMLLQVAKRIGIDTPLDGLILGVTVGAGFALVENIVYGMSTFFSGGIINAVGLVVVRGGLTFVGHPIYTGLVGWGIGMHRLGLQTSRFNRFWYAVSLHALWNLNIISGFLFQLNTTFRVIVMVFVIVLSLMIMYLHIKPAIRVEKMLYEKGSLASNKKNTPATSRRY